MTRRTKNLLLIAAAIALLAMLPVVGPIVRFILGLGFSLVFFIASLAVGAAFALVAGLVVLAVLGLLAAGVLWWAMRPSRGERIEAEVVGEGYYEQRMRHFDAQLARAERETDADY
ncbi:MAG: hypothetical protein ACLFV4_12180 [Candidatus Hydrogenedentota bacterium]